MSHQILDRVQESITTGSTGTGALTLGGATSKMIGFAAAGFSNGDTFLGLIEHSSAAEWELAICTYSTAGGGQITRGTVRKSSSGTSAVAFSAGAKTISLVEMSAPYVTRVRTQTAAGPATMTIEDYELMVNQTVAAAIAVTLPASPLPGQRCRVSDIKGDALTNNITVSAASGNISGAATHVIAANYASAEYRYNGAEWNVIR